MHAWQAGMILGWRNPGNGHISSQICSTSSSSARNTQCSTAKRKVARLALPELAVGRNADGKIMAKAEMASVAGSCAGCLGSESGLAAGAWASCLDLAQRLVN
jgi:hypothetical protein